MYLSRNLNFARPHPCQMVQQRQDYGKQSKPRRPYQSAICRLRSTYGLNVNFPGTYECLNVFESCPDFEPYMAYVVHVGTAVENVGKINGASDANSVLITHGIQK